MGCRDEKNVIGEILNFRVVSFACMCVRVRVKLFYFLKIGVKIYGTLRKIDLCGST